MSDLASLFGGIADTYGSTDGTTALTQVAADSTIHTKTVTPVELVATVPRNSYGFFFSAYVSTASCHHLLDIMIGGSGSEKVLVPNLAYSIAATASVGPVTPLFVPIFVPKGARLSLRTQSSTASANIECMIHLLAGGFSVPECFRKAVNYGADTAVSTGKVNNAGATAHVETAYSQLTASTNEALKALIVNIGPGSVATFASGSRAFIDIAVGGAGSEKNIFTNLLAVAGGTYSILSPQFYGPFPVNIPAGSRLSFRHQASSTTSAVPCRRVAVSLIGLC